MRTVLPTMLGFALGAGGGVGLSILHAETIEQDGEQRQVVAWVRKNRVVKTDLWTRSLVVGLGCGVLGGAAGYRTGAGGSVIPAAIGAFLGLSAAMYTEKLMPNLHGHAGQQSQELTRLFLGLLGAAVAAEAAMRVRNHVRRAVGVRDPAA